MPYILGASSRYCENDKCEKLFTPMRSDAKYCSSACRVAAHRAKDKFDRDLTRLMEQVSAFFGEYHGSVLSENTSKWLRHMAANLTIMADDADTKREIRLAEVKKHLYIDN